MEKQTIEISKNVYEAIVKISKACGHNSINDTIEAGLKNYVQDLKEASASEEIKPDVILDELSTNFDIENEADAQLLGESLTNYLYELGEKLKIKNIEEQKIYFLRKDNHIEAGFVRVDLIK